MSLVTRRPRTRSTDQVAEAIGVTTRVLRHWITRGYIEPAHPGVGSGSPHRWSDDDLELLGRVKARIDEGFTHEAAFRRERGS